ncbi:MAG: c-type cytochrome [Edaphobacter sp.]|uniref:c-type cytochrome n=1 Tax=Edaphobacter sp. TaxID=1934404 RepID=UPI0023A696EE|nr:c-type cytochrome [Edaphobacter sp.]MDE1177356.1 c-type cytochrome [Edaphobacter sp.]
MLVALIAMLAFAPSLLLAQGDASAGSRIFATNCSGCHGADGRGGERAPDIATDPNISSMADPDLAGFVRNGVAGAGMPAFGYLGDDGIRNVVAYLRQLQGRTGQVKVTGDKFAGRSLFHGEAGCAKCHMMHGEGGFMASDLSSYGSGAPVKRIRTAILDPATIVTPNSEVVEVANGAEVLRGVLRSEDNFKVIVQTEDGSFHRFAKSAVKVTYTGHTMMPADYKSRLSERQLNDIVSYLVLSASKIDPATAGNKHGEQ